MTTPNAREPPCVRARRSSSSEGGSAASPRRSPCAKAAMRSSRSSAARPRGGRRRHLAVAERRAGPARPRPRSGARRRGGQRRPGDHPDVARQAAVVVGDGGDRGPLRRTPERRAPAELLDVLGRGRRRRPVPGRRLHGRPPGRRRGVRRARGRHRGRGGRRRHRRRHRLPPARGADRPGRAARPRTRRVAVVVAVDGFDGDAVTGEAWGHGELFGAARLTQDRVYWFASGAGPGRGPLPRRGARGAARALRRLARPIAGVIGIHPRRDDHPHSAA